MAFLYQSDNVFANPAMENAFMSTVGAAMLPGWKVGLVTSDQFKTAKIDEETKISRFIMSVCTSQAIAAAAANIVPVAGIPLGLALSLSSQISLATGIANIRGYDMSTYEKALPFIGLFIVGDLTAEAFKFVGQQATTVMGKGMLGQMTGKATLAINRAVGFRLLTAYGSTGIINVAKMIPILSVFAGAAIDGSFCFGAATVIEGTTFRGKNAGQRCLADILDDFGAAHLKEPVIREMELDALTFCDGVSRRILRLELPNKDDRDTYMKIMEFACEENGEVKSVFKCGTTIPGKK